MFTIKKYMFPFKLNVGYSKNDENMTLCYDSGKFILYIGERSFIITTDCCLLYTSPSPRDGLLSRMPSSA